MYVCKLALAYVKAVGVLMKASLHRIKSNGTYQVTFMKINNKWYCEVPGFPKEFFDHTMMVGGAFRLLDCYAKGAKRIKLEIHVSDEVNSKLGLKMMKSTLTSGAFYKDLNGDIDEEIWLCPVTLFLLGKYPKNIQIIKINTCVLSEEQIEQILYNAIEYCLIDSRKYLQETIVAEYKKSKSYHHRLSIVEEFAHSVGYKY